MNMNMEELTIRNDSELHQHRLFSLSTTILKRTIKKKKTRYLSIVVYHTNKYFTWCPAICESRGIPILKKINQYVVKCTLK